MKKINDITLGVIGLGYVGFPLAVSFGKKIKTIGFDINKKRVEELTNYIDVTEQLSKDEIKESKNLSFTSNLNDLSCCDVFIIAVPTGIDKNHNPDFTSLLKASETVGSVMKEGCIVIYESTVFPGCTQEQCVPILQKFSGKKFNEGFFVGYSPERINPGDKVHKFENIKKITSGSTKEVSNYIDCLYNLVLKNGTFNVSCIKVAQAAKVIQNTQRDVNIAFVNQLTNIFSRLDIDTKEVLQAACTKWSFLDFKPGLVGGHCLTPETQILMSDGTQKRIQNIKQGEFVITGKGNMKRVNKVYSHEYSGNICYIRGKGMLYGICTTCKHQVYSSLWKEIKGKKQMVDTKMLNSEQLIVYDKKLKKSGTHRLHQFSQVIGTIHKPKFAKLLGFYLAQGFINVNNKKKNSNRVVFAFHEDENEFHLEIQNLVKELYGCNVVFHKPHKGKCIIVRCYGVEICKDLYKYGNGKCDKKFLNDQVFLWDKESLQNLWNGWFLGDGYIKEGRQISACTVSRRLALDMYRVGLMIGHNLSISCYHKENKKDVYVIRVINKKYRNQNHNTINLIEKTYKDYKGKVFDLQVQDDHSFIANTIVVSNCIGIDPYWLIYKSLEKNFFPKLINDARVINQGMSKDICIRIVEDMIDKDMKIKNSNVLILGFTFKQNCPDIRNTKVYDIYNQFKQKYKCNVDIVDPVAYNVDVKKQYGIQILNKINENKKYDVIILAVAHNCFKNIDLFKIKNEKSVVFDVKSFFDKKDIDDRL